MRTWQLPTLALALVTTGLVACTGGEPSRPVDTRVLVVGIDGADWQVIDQLVAQGQLPHLSGLRERGVWAELETLHDIALSPAIWTSIATGHQASDHGIGWFLVDDGDGGRSPVTRHNRRTTAIWNILAAAGLRASVVGWWATYPAEDVGGGVVVSDALGYHGFGRITRRSEAEHLAHPPQRGAWAGARIPALHQIGFGFAGRFFRLPADEWQRLSYRPARDGQPNPANPLHLFQMYAVTAQGYTAITEDLLSERDDHLTMVYFEQVDSLSHLFMKCAPPRLPWISDEDFARYGDVVHEWYRYQDELLGRLLEHVDLETTAVVVVSDHGFKSGDRRIRSEQLVDLGTAHLDHERYGILVAAGPHIRRGTRLTAASVLDLTPTLLHYLGLPVARDMEGRVLEEALTPEFAARHPVRWVASHEPVEGTPPSRHGAGDGADADEVRRGLAALGYVEPAHEPTAPATSPEIHNALARSHLLKGEADAARHEAGLALAADPDNADALVILATAAGLEGRTAQAEQLVRQALQHDPDSPNALAELASIMLHQERLDESERLYSDALRLQPDAPHLLLGLGDTLQRAGRLDEAEQAFRRVLELDPDSFEARYNLGVVHQRRGRVDQAVAAYREAVDAQPHHHAAALAWNNLGDISLRRGDEPEALELFERAAAASPTHFEARFNLGSIHLLAGRPVQAIPPLEAAAALQPAHQLTALRLGLAYADTGRLDDARRTLRLLSRLEPGAWPVVVLQAAVEAAAGRPQEAATLLAEARNQGGDQAMYEARMCRCLGGVGS